MFPFPQQQQFCSSPTTGAYPPPMQQFSPFTFSQQQPPWVDEMFKRMDNFESKLDKLEQIDKKVTTINAKVLRLEQGTNSLDERLEHVEKCTQLISDDYDGQKVKFADMKTELTNISKAMKYSTFEVNKIDKKLTSSVSDLQNECGKLKESILDIQMKSTSNNLIFYNIPEAEIETEICSEVIQRFCADTMKIENPERIHVIDAHRLEKKV
ncbi:unnamed protein product [Mytilus edulis]|uniref:Uncharacterized protein n=1 Tax=Mytilus edulis TaxID=6550 RepID=A0A8S3R3U9_MYTED|nr:unnamed protein product [Mytilus edulis]